VGSCRHGASPSVQFKEFRSRSLLPTRNSGASPCTNVANLHLLTGLRIAYDDIGACYRNTSLRLLRDCSLWPQQSRWTASALSKDASVLECEVLSCILYNQLTVPSRQKDLHQSQPSRLDACLERWGVSQIHFNLGDIKTPVGSDERCPDRRLNFVHSEPNQPSFFPDGLNGRPAAHHCHWSKQLLGPSILVWASRVSCAYRHNTSDLHCSRGKKGPPAGSFRWLIHVSAGDTPPAYKHSYSCSHRDTDAAV
jgi:hypothetical protein